WVKNPGSAAKYSQQRETDQPRAFQKAFTLALITSSACFVFVSHALPIWAIAYGHESIILPGIGASLSVVISAFETPSWIPYRRLQYARQRYLTAVDPIVGFTVTIVMAVQGAGYWCFVGGILAGSVVGAT